MPGTARDPKIELHVHLEGTVRPDTLRAIAKRNDYALPDDLESLYRFRDFAHFIEVWILTTNALSTAEDFRQVVTDYAGEAAAHGAVYLEAIFSPAERVARGVGWDEIFTGYCDGAEQARELHGVEVRLTPDIYRGATAENAETPGTTSVSMPKACDWSSATTMISSAPARSCPTPTRRA
jgi:aminodeoxyfutalosine deaminase